MTGYLPRHTPGHAITRTASDTIIAGRLIDATGAHAAEGSLTVIGVAAQDTTEGAPVTVYSGGIQHLIAADAVAAGDLLVAAEDGKVAPATEATPGDDDNAGTPGSDPLSIIGIALAAGGADADIDVKFLR